MPAFPAQQIIEIIETLYAPIKYQGVLQYRHSYQEPEERYSAKKARILAPETASPTLSSLIESALLEEGVKEGYTIRELGDYSILIELMGPRPVNYLGAQIIKLLQKKLDISPTEEYYYAINDWQQLPHSLEGHFKIGSPAIQKSPFKGGLTLYRYSISMEKKVKERLPRGWYCTCWYDCTWNFFFVQGLFYENFNTPALSTRRERFLLQKEATDLITQQGRFIARLVIHRNASSLYRKRKMNLIHALSYEGNSFEEIVARLEQQGWSLERFTSEEEGELWIFSMLGDSDRELKRELEKILKELFFVEAHGAVEPRQVVVFADNGIQGLYLIPHLVSNTVIVRALKKFIKNQGFTGWVYRYESFQKKD